jgi:hypothetical protein
VYLRTAVRVSRLETEKGKLSRFGVVILARDLPRGSCSVVFIGYGDFVVVERAFATQAREITRVGCDFHWSNKMQWVVWRQSRCTGDSHETIHSATTWSRSSMRIDCRLGSRQSGTLPTVGRVPASHAKFVARARARLRLDACQIQ